MFPSLSKALVGTNGKLTPKTLIKLLKTIKKPDVLDLGLIGVLPEYQMKGVASALINIIMEFLQTGEYLYAETNLNLEDNISIQNQWKLFDSRLHKRIRCFIKKIN